MTEDRRVRKSKSAIKSAFIQLLKKNNLESVTIQQISDLADINRGTFYLNYEDKYTLLDEMEDEKIEEVKSYVDISRIEFSGKTANEFIDYFSNYVIKNVITHIEKNLEFYQVVLNLERKSKLEEKFSAIINGNLEFLVGEDSTIIGVPLDYYLSYVSGAMMSMIKYWVQDPNKISVDHLVEFITTIAYNGPLSIMEKILEEKDKYI
jgi:AcrR family transcriptional regulator